MLLAQLTVDVPWWYYAIAVGGGLLAGVINTLAGTGSAITLPILMLLLADDAVMANGTNRVGIALGTIVAVCTFRRSGVLRTGGLGWLVVPAIVGGALGAVIATVQSKDTMTWVILIAMVMSLILVLVRPNRWLHEDHHAAPDHKTLGTVIVFFGLGMYGGFIQLGVGVLLLTALVLSAGYTLVRANAIKVLIVFVFILPSLIVFAWQGQVNWTIGLIMASGQMTGAYLAARFAAHHPQANVWIRRLLIVMIVVAIAKISYDVLQPESPPAENRPADRTSAILGDRG
jgi:uncharacterized membrane protein YfcA